MGWWLPRAEIWILGLGYIFRYKISIQKISFLGENIVEVVPLSCTVNHQHWERSLITAFFFFLQRIFWFDLRLSTIMGISTDFEKESILIQDCCREWRWVFSYALPKSNGCSTSPAPMGRELWDCKPDLWGRREALHRCFTHLYVTGKGEDAVGVLSELWWL